MTNKQILEKAIDKAVENGYSSTIEWGLIKKMLGIEYLLKRIDFDKPVYYSIIFSHDFAKAFWGEKVNRTITERDFNLKTGKEGKGCIASPISEWQYHLQQMVLEKEPIKYIRKFL